MANDIIKQLQSAATKDATISGVSISKESTWCNTFCGTAEALIASGLIAADQLPGQPNMPKVSATFYNGILCDDRRRRVPRDFGYLNVSRPATGKKVRVQVGISADEAKKRRDASNAERATTLAARAAKQTEASRGAISEIGFRAMGADLVSALWRLGCTESRGSVDSYPFEMDNEGAEMLRDALKRVLQLFQSTPLQAITNDRVSLEKARNDSVFQSFLRAQCIPTTGESHA